MEVEQVRQLCLGRLNLRVHQHMGQYVLKHAGRESLAVIGADARTGVAVRRVVRPAELLAPLPDDRPASSTS